MAKYIVDNEPNEKAIASTFEQKVAPRFDPREEWLSGCAALAHEAEARQKRRTKPKLGKNRHWHEFFKLFWNKTRRRALSFRPSSPA